MTEPYFFEIPIYRCDQSTHTNEMKNSEEKLVDEFHHFNSKSHEDRMRNYFHNSKWYPWRYNEVIGWLCLYIMGTQLRGEIWFESSKRINKGIRKKKFKWVGKAFEHNIRNRSESDEIFTEFVEVLEQLKSKDNFFRKRHLDLSVFKVNGRFINWVELIDKLNSFKYGRIKIT